MSNTLKVLRPFKPPPLFCTNCKKIWHIIIDCTEIKCFKPEFNTASKIFLPMEHTVFSVTPDAPPRNAIQIFAK